MIREHSTRFFANLFEKLHEIYSFSRKFINCKKKRKQGEVKTTKEQITTKVINKVVKELFLFLCLPLGLTINF